MGTILTGLLSFMHDTQPTTGSITTTPEEKRRLAADSLAHNARNPLFRKLFPEWVEELARREQQQQQLQQEQSSQQQEEEQERGEEEGEGGRRRRGGGEGEGRADGAVAEQAGVQGVGAAGGGRAGAARGRAAARTGQGAAGGGAGVGQRLLTVAVVVAVVALAVAPLLSWSRQGVAEAYAGVVA